MHTYKANCLFIDIYYRYKTYKTINLWYMRSTAVIIDNLPPTAGEGNNLTSDSAFAAFHFTLW